MTSQPALRARTAAERPAPPLPRTRTSVMGAFRLGRAVSALRRDVAHGLDDGAVLFVDEHDQRFVSLELRFVVVRVADDDDLVTGVHEPRGRAIDDHVAGTTADDVGLETRTVVDVEHGHLLVLDDVGELHEARVECDRTDVVEIRAGHGGPVDLRLHHDPVHGQPTWSVDAGMSPRSTDTESPSNDTAMLSMRRVVPTKAASAMRVSRSSRSIACSVAASTTSA